MMLRAAFVPPEEVVEELRALAGRLGSLPGVHPVPADRLDVRIAAMGNVAEKDARSLARKIESWSGLAALPEMRWQGVQVQPNGDVGVCLVGDVAGLRDVVRAVGVCAEKVHVFVDRRSFSPMLVVATVDEQQPGSRVGSALAGMGDWTGGSWTVAEVALIRIRWLAGHDVSEIVERVPIPTQPTAAQPEQV